MANKISVLIDVVTTGANKSLGDFKRSIDDADGAVGKMKAGFAGAKDAIVANAGNLAMAGGAALVAFGVKAVGEFQTVALEAGKMSDALGIPVDDISRLIEVAGDLGIETGTLETSIGRMNVTAGKTPGYFDEIGASIVRNKDGTINVKDTFLKVVDALNAMPDGAKRAEAAQKIFGRGWKDMAELIGQGSDTITQSMKDVSEAQAISPEEVQKARDYKAAMEDLKDTIGQITLTVGEALVPVLTDAAEALVGVKEMSEDADEAVGPLDEGLFGLAKRNYELFNPVGQAITIFGALGDQFGDTEEDADSLGEHFVARMYEMQGASRDLTGELEDTKNDYIEFARGMQDESKKTAAKLTADWDRITGKISDETAYLTAKGEFASLRDAAVRAWEEGEAGVDEYRLAQLEAQQGVTDYIKELGDIPPEVASEIISLIDQNRLDEAERKLAELARPRTSTLTIQVNRVGDIIGNTIDGRRASGGPVNAGGTYLVGEDGPEILQLGSKSGNVIPNDKIQSNPTSLGGMDPAAWGRMAADAFARRMQQNGRVA